MLLPDRNNRKYPRAMFHIQCLN